jgi:pseudaminic acid biosynthesis-associated methylase
MNTTPPLSEQEEFWKGDFGAEYLSRNTFDPDGLDGFYLKTYGTKRSAMNLEFLPLISPQSFLEVGCNTGNQLRLLSHQGYKNLSGIEINNEAAEIAKLNCPSAVIQTGSAFSLPFPDHSFDVVFTSGVLIHIHPDDLPKAMTEMIRCSKKWIWGFEYYSETPEEINYRGNSNRLWKRNYAAEFQKTDPSLRLLKSKLYRYADNSNSDQMYILEKI